jgi:hypothetical protein
MAYDSITIKTTNGTYTFYYYERDEASEMPARSLVKDMSGEVQSLTEAQAKVIADGYQEQAKEDEALIRAIVRDEIVRYFNAGRHPGGFQLPTIRDL